jgi:tRNA (mo5U34)-methyltransferase
MTDNPETPGPSDDEVRAEVAANPLWYHTMDLRPGITTPGWFDLRGITERMPWPDVRGKRCLDIGTYDGQLAFELERRGAAEVVATDISDHALWDWPFELRVQGPERLAVIAGEKGAGFEIAARALNSSVKKIAVSVYDLDPARIGTFDVVVCGALLLHLRDPVLAVERVRSVCSGTFLSAEQIDPWMTLVHRRTPLTNMSGIGEHMQWHVPNRAAHAQILRAGGFRIERTARPYPVAFGPAHPVVARGWSRLKREAVCRLVCGGFGVPHDAVLCRPA